jgi:hypothetical protein
MPPYVKTPVAAQYLEISYSRLMSLLRHGKICPPRKDSSGDYVWTEEDLDAARSVLAPATRRAAKG